MGQDIQATPIGEVRVASTASGGTALTTTAAFISLFRGTNYITLTARNVAGAVVVRYALNPYLLVLTTSDALATAANLTDGSANLQDADASTNMSIAGALLSGNFMYIGAHQRFRGVRVIMGTANTAASVLSAKYRKSDDTWAAVAGFSDGTISAGATFGQTGNITWTVPTDWIARSLKDIMGTDAVSIMAPEAQPGILTQKYYWTRWGVTVALDTPCTVTGMQAMNRSTTYGEFDVGVVPECRVHVGPPGLGCIEALTDAGTANLIVNCATLGVESEFV